MSAVSELINKICHLVGKVSGIGHAVSYRACASNVATLTTETVHGCAAGQVVLVRGVDSAYDGYRTVVAAPTTTSLTFALTHADETSTAVSPTGAVSLRVSQGKRRFAEIENFETIMQALTSETQGHFSCWLDERSSGTQELAMSGTATIVGLLYFRLPKDTSTDCVSLINTCESILGAITSDQLFSGGVLDGSGARYKINVTDDPRDEIVVVEFEARFRVCNAGLA